jgi:hypothetical protein
MRIPTCPECYKQGLLVSGKEVYSHRPDLYKKWFYVCKKHDTRVGCHSNTKEPLSSKMAGGQLRLLRSQTHGMLDPLWRNGHFPSRGVAYSWLAKEMEISTEACHVSMFDQNECLKAISILNSYCGELQAEAHEELQKDKWKSKNSIFNKVKQNET